MCIPRRTDQAEQTSEQTKQTHGRNHVSCIYVLLFLFALSPSIFIRVCIKFDHIVVTIYTCPHPLWIQFRPYTNIVNMHSAQVVVVLSQRIASHPKRYHAPPKQKSRLCVTPEHRHQAPGDKIVIIYTR
ncbi:hypothetical protein BDV41DRAFT_417267 [Aspergillus transmontanensis]|uniref:Uncharacterized protein n=1 Tax=Aspergillus transmontanensis TaxID=1034304 RepID=A0A5N6VRV0_9EURO|nr:hypothetical protein BDV41DRAFT_417267 [Aspergillus transmontanensis]